MAINRISGNILQDNLQRGTDLAIQGNLIYFDVINNRVGIRTSSPSDDFEVDGVLRVGNVVIDSAGNISAGGNYINDLAEPSVNSDAATKFYVDSATGNVVANLGNIIFTNTTISTSLANASLTLLPTSNNVVIIDTVSGLILPVGDTSQRPGSAQIGTLRFNSDTARLEVYDGAEWDSVVGGVTAQVITPDGSSLIYTLDRDSTTPATLVALNGVIQLPIVAYTVSGNTITFTEAPLTTDIVDIRFL